jgi:exo-beta-1,3-glucanase (GH17 family)
VIASGSGTDIPSWPPMLWPDQPVRIDPPSRRELFKLRVLIVAATTSLFATLGWLVNPLRVGDPVAYYGLTTAVFLRAICWLLEWYNYWGITVPPVIKPRRRWTVDVLTTACPGEPAGMIVRTLKAMVKIRYPHTNYLCDEGNDPYLKKVCQELGVIHVTRTEKKYAKAGNINNALAQATGKIAVVLDPDHEPSPYLLDRTLGYFEDPAVGFVQSVQAYRNQKDSFVARGAAEQSYHFYGPYMMGMHGYGTTQAIGANCVFRRAALDSIGGHAPGLAEDMHTSMRLYSKGWRSVYLPEILTRGLVPSTLSGFYKQQIKWSCGVFDLLFQEYPSLFKGFTLRQKIHYFLCPMFFLRGLIGLIEMVVPIICLAYGLVAWRATLPQVVGWFLPVLVFGTMVRLRVQRWLMEPHERGIHFAGGVLAIATWWVYLIGVACAVVRIKVPYIPTPKEDKPTNAGDLAVPNCIAAGVLILASTIGIYRDSSPSALMMAFLASINALALVYVSVASQQVAVMKLWQGLAPVRRIAGPIKLIGRFLRALYHGVLWQAREGSVLPGAVALAVVGLCFGTIFRPTAKDTETPFALNKEIKVGGFYTGIDLGDVTDARRVPRIQAIEQRLDFHFRIVSLDQRWGDAAAFPMQTLKTLRRDGAVPLINWLPTTDPSPDREKAGQGDRAILKAIKQGKFDDYLSRFAGNIRAFGEPVLICFAPQPDNPKMPWSQSGGNSAEDFVAAWRHIAKLFDTEGAANAGWVWVPGKVEDVDSYFPGEAGEGYVDWIGLPINNDNSGGESFAERYEQYRSKVGNWHLPIMVTDLEAHDQDGNAWLQAAMDDIGSQFPEIKGAVFKDSAVSRQASRKAQAGGAVINDAGLAADSQFVSTVDKGLRLKPFNEGVAEASLPDHPLWFDLHQTIVQPRYILGTPGHFTLMVDGAPFFIKGVAYNPGHDWRDANVPLSRRELNEDFAAIQMMGGNTIRRYGRTWSDRNIFNAAADYHLKVLYGFWFFQDVNYLTDTQKELAYQQQIEQTVLEYRNHPGLLGWCLGNEVWGLLKHEYGQPYLTDIRHAHVLFVERMARRIKELDPNHPIFCAQESKQIAGAVSDYAVAAPSVDVIAVNSYYEADIANLDKAITHVNNARPYLVSEFGPDGYWEDENNAYDRQHGLLERTAMEKAWQYAFHWRKYIQPNQGKDLGGIAYCWSDRYEGTATWFGIMDLDRRPKPAYEALRMAWYDSSPTLGGNFPYGGPKIVNVSYPTTPQWPNEPFIVKADVDVYRNQPLRYLWSVTGPGFSTNVGRVTPLRDGSAASIELPAIPGWYRVQLKVLDPLGLDEANVPVKVEASDTSDSTSEGTFGK